jgi:TctA family transporter
LPVPVRRPAGKTGVANGDLMTTFVEHPISLALVIFILVVLMLPPAIRLLRARQAAWHRGAVQNEPGGQR